VRVVLARLAAEVAPPVVVARLLVLGPKALHGRPRLEQCAVDAEVIAAHQVGNLSSDREEERRRHVVLHQTRAVLGEGARVEGRLEHVHVEEPAEQQVVLELLAELPLASERVQRDEQRALQQPLRRDRRAAPLGVHRVEVRGQGVQRLVREPSDRPYGMVARDARLRADRAEHRGLFGASTAHANGSSHPVAGVDPQRNLRALGPMSSAWHSTTPSSTSTGAPSRSSVSATRS